MARYKYRIVKDGDWHFELLPNNSDTQYVGYSSGYPTKEETLIGLKRFKEFLRKNKSNFIYEKLETEKGNPYYASLKFSDDEIFCTRRYQYRYEINNSINRIKHNFEVDIKDDLTFIVKERKA